MADATEADASEGDGQRRWRSTARPFLRGRFRAGRVRLSESEVLREVRLRWRRTVLLATLTGVLTGAGVHAFDWVTREALLERATGARLAVHMVAPGLGLLATALALRYLARRASPSLADEYVVDFHDRHRSLALWPLGGRMAAGVATVGGGGALGLEGGSIYLGASIGSLIQRRFKDWFARDESKILMVAGAAAGVAAIFKAPLTGAVFAVEVPYRYDLAARAVLPALVGAAASYVTFVSFQGTDPILAIRGDPAFSVVDLGGAALLGLLCGVGARGFAAMVAWTKEQAKRARLRRRLPAAAAVLAGLAAGAYALYDHALTLGPGYEAVAWAASPTRSLGLVALLFLMRAAATGFTLIGGGAGGVFVPLVVQGALLGRLVGGVFDETGTSLFLVVGMAAFLGAGYRAPIAAAAFVAESTGHPGYAIPGLIAAVLAELVMGDGSVAPDQQIRRTGHLDRRLRLPITAGLVRDVHTVPPGTSLAALVDEHVVRARARIIPVVNDGRYVGLVSLDDVERVPRDQWVTTSVSDVMMTVLPPAELSWTLRRAITVMEEHGVTRLAVTDHGRFVGVATQREILRLDEILDETDV